MAFAYANLRNVYYIYEDMGQAETLYRQALAIDEALGRKEGMAYVYLNLGNVYGVRGDLAQAEAMYRKSLGLFRELGATTAGSEQIRELLNVLAKIETNR